jgi:hypothetical protein
VNISSSDQYLPLPLLRGNYRYTLAIGNLTENVVLQFQPAGADWYNYTGTAVTASESVNSGVMQITALNCPMRLAFAAAPASPYHVTAAYEVYPHN